MTQITKMKHNRDDFSKTISGQRAPLTIREPYAFFWRQWPSNWESSPFVLDGRQYSCVEQWMMAQKANVFGDAATENLIMEASHPAE